ncbi:molybdate ABC transporter substrate-binding protein [Microbacterium sp. STN6]|uniref:molybdate ABC transporter substrate-binding protein n=1 Tax=Microbacterium sp. STN6 TaxID=2995588 RepID=UPI002260C8C6|nr:molybdate ABC transporter substrate-binding protein [Microbacterium sp. STN6]MCX7520854.1 molybdate ABC transporter substrate-binding protein [Microbacterium sp. STN6]
MRASARPATGTRATRRRRVLATAVLAASALLLSGCATAADGTAGPAAGGSPGAGHTSAALSGDLTIFAAASLTDAFTELATRFGEKHLGVTVKPVEYDGSSTLATQLIEGAHADVFASADQTNIDKVGDAGLLEGSPRAFTSNVLEIAVAPGNPHHITGLADLASSGLKVVLCAPEVPCGSAARTLLDADHVTVKPASDEQNVTAVLTKVGLGEADAGLVYVTDVTAAKGRVDGVPIPDAAKATNRYGIGVPKAAENPAAGRAFVAFVLSKHGQAVLARYGFGSP